MNKEEIRQRISDLETALQNPNLLQEQKTKIENELYGLREIERNIFAQELEVAAKKQTSGTSSALTGIIGLPMAFFFRKKPLEVIEEEKEYQKIAKELKTPFAKKNGKEFYDCLYGSLDDPNTPSLHQNTMNQIKKYGALYERCEKDKENPELKPYKNYKKYRDLIAKYSKKDKLVHKKIKDDPVVARIKLQIKEEVENRFGEAKNSPVSGKYISTVLEPKRWEGFVQRYPEKAKVYAQQDENIKKAYDQWQIKQETTTSEQKPAQETEMPAAAPQTAKTPPPQTSTTPSAPPKEKEEERPSTNVYNQYQNWQARFNKLQKWWSKGGKQSVKNLTADARGFVSRGFSKTSTRLVNVGNKLFSFGGRFGFLGGGAGGGATATASVVGGGTTAGGVAAGALGAETATVGGGAMVAGGWIPVVIFALIVLVIVIIIFLFSLGGGKFETPPPTISGGTCPTQAEITANRSTTPGTCKYLNAGIDIFGDVTGEQIQKYIDLYEKSSKRYDFVERVNDIVNKSRSVGLSPVIFLGYWKSEGNFSYSFGCDPTHPPYTFEVELNCALGLSAGGGSATARCARSVVEKDPIKKAELEKACDALRQIRQNPIYQNYLVSIPIKTFDDFVETYGSATPLLGDAPANYNCINTYNTLLEVATNLGSCSSASSISKPFTFVYYCQHDQRWAYTCSLTSSGCGPTTMAMVLSSFGEAITPPEMDQIFQNYYWRGCGDTGSNMVGAINGLLPSKGFQIQLLTYKKTLDLYEAKKYLDAGYLIIGSISWHIFVVDSVNIANNTVHLRDPNESCNPNGYDAPANRPWRGEDWFFAYAVKKIKM